MLALATHVRLVALIPTLFVAVALQCGFARSLEPARRQAVLLAGTAAVCAVTLAGFAAAGHWNDVFGAYAAAAGGYELGAVAADVIWHFAGIFILVAGIPLIALAAMTIECVRRRESDPAAVCARRDHARLDLVPRARSRNVRLALGRARHAAGPPAGHTRR